MKLPPRDLWLEIGSVVLSGLIVAVVFWGLLVAFSA